MRWTAYTCAVTEKEIESCGSGGDSADNVRNGECDYGDILFEVVHELEVYGDKAE